MQRKAHGVEANGTPSRDLAVALVGFGYAGKTIHAPLIQATEGLRLAEVVSSRRDEIHRMYPEATVLDASGDWLRQSQSDLVVIAAPNLAHRPLAEKALRAGRHAVVDKPLGITPDEVRFLRDLSLKTGCLLSPFHNRRWDSDYLALKEIVRSGEIGDVMHFESHMDRFRPVARQRWKESSVEGGGLLLDLGTHLIDQAIDTFRIPGKVTAHLAQQRINSAAEDWMHLILEYERLRVILHASLLAVGGTPRFLLHGAGGSWKKRGGDIQESQLQAGKLPLSEGWGADPENSELMSPGNSSRVYLPVPAGNYMTYYSELRDAIRYGTPLPCTVHEALAVASVVEAAQRSSRSGCAEVPSITFEEISKIKRIQA